MNKIIIKGRLAHNPDLRTTTSDVPVCSFDVAVNRSFDREVTDFFRCNAWRKTGEFVHKYFKKGQEILVSGEMQSRKWVDKDGSNHVSWEINVDTVEFCGSKADAAAPENIATPKGDAESSEELPF